MSTESSYIEDAITYLLANQLPETAPSRLSVDDLFAGDKSEVLTLKTNSEVVSYCQVLFPSLTRPISKTRFKQSVPNPEFRKKIKDALCDYLFAYWSGNPPIISIESFLLDKEKTITRMIYILKEAIRRRSSGSISGHIEADSPNLSEIIFRIKEENDQLTSVVRNLFTEVDLLKKTVSHLQSALASFNDEASKRKRFDVQSESYSDQHYFSLNESDAMSIPSIPSSFLNLFTDDINFAPDLGETSVGEEIPKQLLVPCQQIANDDMSSLANSSWLAIVSESSQDDASADAMKSKLKELIENEMQLQNSKI